MTEAELRDKLQSIVNRCRIAQVCLQLNVPVVHDALATLFEDSLQDLQDIVEAHCVRD
jgi:hypothetical protein